ncbi:hypothetical protein HRbin11_01944 [bacterium HR11]|nr:hypothetical protein HRbin11_01944 [bacterium HR11]
MKMARWPNARMPEPETQRLILHLAPCILYLVSSILILRPLGRPSMEEVRLTQLCAAGG